MLALVPGLAPGARAASPRTAAAAADTLAHAAPAAPAVADTAGQGEAAARAAKPPWTEQPRIVMLRSAILPGWGQFHNGAYVKAAAVAGGEAWIVATILRQQHDLDRISADASRALAGGDEAGYNVLAARYNDTLSAQVGSEWLLGGVLAFALVDAYVDAHFRGFEIEFRNDPALPPGTGTPAVRSSERAARLSLGWHF